MITIDTRSSKPLYEQIADNIKSDVVRGYLKAGDEMPSVRRMAMELSVTPNTVSKAYQELERAGVIETIRGKGTYISRDYEVRIDEGRMRQIEKELTTQVVELAYMGMTRDEIIKLIDRIYNDIKEAK